MGEVLFQIPRQSDLQVIEALRAITEGAGLGGPQLYYHPFEGGNSKTLAFSQYAEDDLLKTILPLHQASLLSISLNSNNHGIVNVRRVNKTMFDECRVTWNGRSDGMNDGVYLKTVALAKKHLKEVKVDETMAVAPDGQLKGMLEAQIA